jgi:hypothetical protein
MFSKDLHGTELSLLPDATDLTSPLFDLGLEGKKLLSDSS